MTELERNRRESEQMRTELVMTGLMGDRVGKN